MRDRTESPGAGAVQLAPTAQPALWRLGAFEVQETVGPDLICYTDKFVEPLA